MITVNINVETAVVLDAAGSDGYLAVLYTSLGWNAANSLSVVSYTPKSAAAFAYTFKLSTPPSEVALAASATASRRRALAAQLGRARALAVATGRAVLSTTEAAAVASAQVTSIFNDGTLTDALASSGIATSLGYSDAAAALTLPNSGASRLPRKGSAHASRSAVTLPA